MYYAYILYSKKLDTFYKGSTNDIKSRIYRHNHGFEKFTKKGAPWELIWFTEKKSKSEAVKLEMKLKNLSKKRLQAFILKYHINIYRKTNPDIFKHCVGSNLDEII